MRRSQQRAESRILEQLRLGEEADTARALTGNPGQSERVEIRHVIARKDRRAVRRDVRLAFDRPAQAESQPGPEHRLRGGIHRVHGR